MSLETRPVWKGRVMTSTENQAPKFDRYRLMRALRETVRGGGYGQNMSALEIIAKQNGVDVAALNRETALAMLSDDYAAPGRWGLFARANVTDHATIYGVVPADVVSMATGRTGEAEPLTVLAFDPGDTTGWCCARLELTGDVALLGAGAFLVDSPEGNKWIERFGADEQRGMMRERVHHALTTQAHHEPRMPEQLRYHRQGNERIVTSARSEPGSAATALIQHFRPDVVACEWIYHVFPIAPTHVDAARTLMGKAPPQAVVEWLESICPDQDIRRRSFFPGATGLHRAGVIAGAIRHASRCVGVPFLHVDAAQARRAVVGKYRATDSEISSAIGAMRNDGILSVETGEGKSSMATPHPKDAVIVALCIMGVHHASPEIEEQERALEAEREAKQRAREAEKAQRKAEKEAERARTKGARKGRRMNPPSPGHDPLAPSVM